MLEKNNYRKAGLATIGEISGWKANMFFRQKDEQWLNKAILPAGFWERSYVDIRVKEETKLMVTTSVHDLTRHQFLEQLDWEKIINPVLGGKRQYRAFVFCTVSGKRIALVEADHTQNALYVFDADDADWEELVSWSKWEVIKFGKPFLKRIYHRGQWQDEVMKLLQS